MYEAPDFLFSVPQNNLS